jgi:hypothetical protein
MLKSFFYDHPVDRYLLLISNHQIAIRAPAIETILRGHQRGVGGEVVTNVNSLVSRTGIF